MNDGPNSGNPDYVPALGDSLGTVWRSISYDAGLLDEDARSGFQENSSTVSNSEDNVDADVEVLGPTEQLTSEIVSRIKRAPFKPLRRYLSDVLACGDYGEACRIARRVISFARNYPGNLCLVSVHDDHVHVVHDCPYAGSSCRCQILKEAEIKSVLRGSLRKRPPISTIEPDSWQRIVFYFVSNGRWLQFAKVGGHVVRLSDGYKSLQSRGHQGDELGQVLGTCTVQGSGELWSEGSVEESNRPAQGPSNGHRRRKRKRSVNLREEMEKIINEHPVCPLAGIVSTRQWLTHPELKMYRGNHDIVKSFLDGKAEEICYWTMHDFYNFYNQENCTPTFLAGYQPVESKYYSLDDSVTILNKLLQFQFDEDVASIKNFLTWVYNIIERKIPKCNTLCIYSPPSAGKNYFFDCFIHFLWNCGQLGTVNKTNNFSFQEATSKRILLWNEPNYEPDFTDTLKMITAGDAFTVRVKQQKDMHVYTTPLIVLTNNRVGFMYESAFQDRVKTFTWRPAPFLKEYDRKPTPLAAFEILVYWDIIKRHVE